MKAQNEEIHLLDYWRILQKRRRVALTFFLIVVGIASIYCFAATPIYQGSSQVLTDLENNGTLNFTESGAAVIQQKDAVEHFNTQKTILTSRAFADRVVRKLRLDKTPYFIDLKDKRNNSLIATISKTVKSIFPKSAKQANPLPNVKFKDELDPDLTDIVLENVDLNIGQQNDIMTISYNDNDPQVAAGMANGVSEAFIEHNLDIKVKPFRDAAEWLSARIVESKAKVEVTEKALQQYKEVKGAVSFEAKESVLTQRLQELMTSLSQTEGKRQEAEIKYNQIKSVINKPELLATVPDIMNNLVIQGLRNEELGLKKQLSDLSEKYGSKHPQLIKTKSELETVQRNIIAEARKMLSAAQADFEVAKNREISLRRTLEQQKQEVLDLSRKAIDFNVIAGESGSNKQFYELLLKKLQEASLSSGINISNVQVVDYAVIPKYPVKPNRALTILLAIMFGLVGGIFVAFFTEYMDDTVKTSEDVSKILDLPFLDIVPLTDEKKGPIYVASDPKSATAESYRTIRTGVMLSAAGKQLKVILVTSTIPNEGKTTTAANLAVAMAQMGEKVLIIDADMRRHNLHEILGLSNPMGISDVIADPGNLSSAIKKVADYATLDAITGGTLAPNPSELLGSSGMTELVSQLAEKYDRIILDSPPLLAFSDSLVLSRLADGVILVVWGGETERDKIQHAIQSLRGVQAKILGVVLNKIDTTRKGYSYYPYYSYYYSDNKNKDKKDLNKKRK